MRTFLATLLIAGLSNAPAVAGEPDCTTLLQAQAAQALGLDAAAVRVMLTTEPAFKGPLADYTFEFAAVPRGRVVVCARSPKATGLSFVADVQIWGDALVAQRRIERGMPLDPSQFVLVRRDITDASPVRIDEINGLRARRTIAAGALLTTEISETVPLVDRGSPVTVTAQHGSVKVSRNGTALSDARLGEPLRVRLDGRTIIGTIVTGPGLCAAGS